MNDKLYIMKNNEKTYDEIEKQDKTLEDYEKEDLKEFDKQLKIYSHHHKMYQRIIAAKMVKLGETRIKVAEYLNVNRQTVGLG